MAKFEHYEKFNMLEVYILSDKNVDAAAELYFNRYPERRQPDRRIFKKLENNLQNFGSFDKGRPKKYATEKNEINSIVVLGNVEADPTTSSREMEINLGISKTTSLRILKKINIGRII